MITPAYTHVTSYLRVSSTEQVKGTGLDGQRLDCEVLAKHLGVVIDVELVEGGKSGFHAKHRAEGGVFHAYERDVIAGLHHGSLLILSKLDRLTRENSDDASDLMRTLSRHGVTIATADDKEVYQAGVPKRLDQGIKALLKIEVAHEEQAKKADRLRASYDVRHERCRNLKLAVTSNVMPWIIVDKKTRKMRLHALHAETARYIFRLADAEGMGAWQIAKRLTAEGVKTWSTRKGHRGVWSRTVIDKVLRSRVAVGEFQPTRDGKENGEPWLGHFPAVVAADVFERINRNATVRKNSNQRRDEKISNLVGGLAKCRCCGANLEYRKGRSAGSVITTRAGKSYTYHRDNGSLVCPTGIMKGSACPNDNYLAYLTFESALLGACLHLAMDDTAWARKDEVGRLNITIAEIERELDVALTTARNMAEAWAKRPSELREKMMDEAEDAAAELTTKVAALRQQREDAKGKVSSQEHLARVADIRANMYHDDLQERVALRRKVRQALRNVIHSIKLDADRSVTVVFDGGLVAFRIAGKKIEPINDMLNAIRSGVIPLPRRGGEPFSPVKTQIIQRLEKSAKAHSG